MLHVDRRNLAERMREGDSYGLLMICIVATYILMAVAPAGPWAQALTGLAFGATLLLALHTSHVRGRHIRVAGVVVVVLIVFNLALALGDQQPFPGASSLIVLLIVMAPFVVLVRIFKHPVVNLETILGAVDAYLLIGIAFAAVYLEANAIGVREFTPAKFFFVQGAATRLDFLYFSFVTLSTLGYGDFTPATQLGKVIGHLRGALRPAVPGHGGGRAGLEPRSVPHCGGRRRPARGDRRNGARRRGQLRSPRL